MAERRKAERSCAEATSVRLSPAGASHGPDAPKAHRRTADETPQASEERYKLALSGSGDGLWDWDLVSGRVYFSPRLLEICGFASDLAFIPEGRVIDCIHADDRERYKEALRAHLRGDKARFECEMRVIGRDRRVRWVLDRGRALRDSQGRAIRMAGTVMEFTERHEAEVALREGEQRYQLLSDYASDWIWEMDAELRFSFFSERFAKITGVDPALLIGKRRWEITEEDTDAEHWRRHRADLEAHRPFHDFRYSTSRPFGRLRHQSLNGRPLFDEHGVFRGYRGTARDITDEVMAQQALAESERRLADAAHLAKLGYRVWDLAAGKAVHVSDEMVRIYGLSSLEEALEAFSSRAAAAEWIHPDDLDRVERAEEKAIETGEGYGLEYRMVLRDGEVRHLHLIGEVLRDESGRALQLRATIQDITDEVAAKEALRESESRLADATRLAKVGYLTWDEQQDRPIHASEEYFRALGLASEAEFLKRFKSRKQLHEALFHPEDIDRCNAEIRQAVAEARNTELEHRIVRPDGEVRHVRAIAERVADAQGRTLRSHVSIQDITDLRRAEAALRENEARFRAIFENTSDIIAVISPDGTMLMQSPSVTELLGYRPEERVGESATKYVHAQDLDKVAHAVECLIKKPDELVSLRLRLRHKDRSWRIFDTLGRNAVEVPGIGGLVFTSRDVTAQVELEEHLRQAQKMEAVGQLTGGVAHDFNNILGIVMGNLEIAKDRLAPGSDLSRYLESAIQATQRGATLTQRLLAFSRKQPLKPESVHVDRLTQSMSDMLRRSLGETIEIEIAGDAGLWPCRVDPGQLENALLNLAINARDAMPEGGKLTIEASNTRIGDDYTSAQDELEPGQYVQVAVTDNGVGIPADVIERVFDPFFTTKEVGRGSGLGLSMVYGFAKQSGGHASIDSEQGRGTTIKLYLPRDYGSESAAEDEEMSELPSAARGEVVLVVEDDADLRRLVVAILRSFGFSVLEAATATSALEVFDKAPSIDLVLSDVVLPGGLSGRQLSEELKRRNPKLPVLFTSGYAESAIHNQGYLDPGVLLLQKPFRKADVARAVHKALKMGGS
ncbi:MAG: PAS domain S-box protein [Kiloniellales bacterium]|nr:PAS domain S-box protein [Kiloniellales bacterium]